MVTSPRKPEANSECPEKVLSNFWAILVWSGLLWVLFTVETFLTFQNVLRNFEMFGMFWDIWVCFRKI